MSAKGAMRATTFLPWILSVGLALAAALLAPRLPDAAWRPSAGSASTASGPGLSWQRMSKVPASVDLTDAATARASGRTTKICAPVSTMRLRTDDATVPLAMATYDIMPPPAAKEKAVGEERIVNYTGAGLSLGAEIDVDPATAEWAKGLPEDADLTQALANHVWEKVNEEYKAIEACNVPGGGDVPLPSNAVRPVRPPSVPVF